MREKHPRSIVVSDCYSTWMVVCQAPAFKDVVYMPYFNSLNKIIIFYFLGANSLQPLLSDKFTNNLNISQVRQFYANRSTTKLTKLPVHPAKARINLGVQPSDQSSLSAWRKESLATHKAHSDDWSDWVDAQTDLSLHLGHMSVC